MFSHRLIFIVNNIFDIGWLAIEYRLYCIYIYIYVIFKSIPNYISPIEMQTPAEPDTGRQLHKYSTMQQAYT